MRVPRMRVALTAVLLLTLSAVLVAAETSSDDLEKQWFEKLGHGHRIVAFNGEILVVESIPGERFEFETLEADDLDVRGMNESLLYDKMRKEANDRTVVRLMEPNSKVTVAQLRMTAAEGRSFGEYAVGLISNGLRPIMLGSHQREISTIMGSLSGRGVRNLFEPSGIYGNYK